LMVKMKLDKLKRDWRWKWNSYEDGIDGEDETPMKMAFEILRAKTMVLRGWKKSNGNVHILAKTILSHIFWIIFYVIPNCITYVLWIVWLLQEKNKIYIEYIILYFLV
jgi:hypothetical protein